MSRPPLRTIPANPPSYSLTGTNPKNTQQSSAYNPHKNSKSMNSLSTSHSPDHTHKTLQNSPFETSKIPSTNIKINPQSSITSTQPLLCTSTQLHQLYLLSITPSHHTIPPSTLHPSKISNQTYIRSSASSSKGNKPFDGLHHHYIPEE